MKRTLLWLVPVCLVSTAVVAQQSGAKVFVRARDTRMTETPRPDGKVIGGFLQVGDELVWHAQDPKAPRYHKVERDSKIGYVYFDTISRSPPKTESRVVNGESRPLDRKASASFGAAARGLTPGAENYAKQGKVDRKEAASQFKKLEDLGDELQKDAGAIPGHLKTAGLAQGGAR